MLIKAQLETTFAPWYDGKDTVHGFEHIRRILRSAEDVAVHYDTIDRDVLTVAAYLHGIPADQRSAASDLLKGILSESQVLDAMLAAAESQKEATPRSLEGMILHDAHLIEGGRMFLIVKSLVAGSARRQSLDETIRFIEQNIIGQFKCFLPEAIPLYAEKEAFALQFLRELKDGLGRA